MTLSYIDVFVTAKIKNFWRMDRELGWQMVVKIKCK